jgi:hypothetical protein
MNKLMENYQTNISTIHFTDDERNSGVCDEKKLRESVQSFHTDGVVILENIISRELISSLHQEYVNRYQGYFKEDLYDDVLHVGNKRMMLQVEIDGVFNDRNVYLHPLMETIVLNLLDREFIVGGFGSVISLPGASAQLLHRDSGPLFKRLQGKSVLPPFAITVSIPLIPQTKETGSTRFVPGSHRVRREDAFNMQYIDPEVLPGSLVMWDYTVFHGGLENRSDKVRPILYLSYTKHWFKDHNYSQHSPIKMNQHNYDLMPEELRRLFTWSRPPVAHAEQSYDQNDPCPCKSGKKYKDCHGKQ